MMELLLLDRISVNNAANTWKKLYPHFPVIAFYTSLLEIHSPIEGLVFS